MTVDKFNDILETFGCDSRHWPESDRETCLQLMAENPQAKDLFERHLLLASNLDQLQVPDFPGLEQRVLSQNLPPRAQGILDRFVNWLLPAADSGSRLWRPALAACLPLVMGIVVGNFTSFGIDTGSDGFQYWEDELIMLSFNEYSEIGSQQ